MIETITKGKVKIVKLNRQPTNALDLCFLNKIYDCLLKTEKEKEIYSVVLASKTKSAFSSGLDLKSLITIDKKHIPKNIIKAVRLVYRIIKLIINSKKIYVASLNGPVIGSAVSIAMACDFRFATTLTWFWLPDPQYGGLLADGGIDIIKSISGISNAKKICMVNDRIDIKTAKKIGLIHGIVEKDIVDDFSNCFASNLTLNCYSTLQNTKTIINHGVLKNFHFFKLLKVVYSKEMLERLEKYNLHGGKNEFSK